jgi:thiol:disulfide interchange protein
MRFYLRAALLLLAGFCVLSATAQIEKPVKWKFSNKKLNNCEYELVFTGTIDEHWHVYSLNQKGEDGPNPSQLMFDKAKEYELVGKPTEGKPVKAYDKVFEMEVLYFEKTVVFKQKIKLLTDKSVSIIGNFEYQACTEEKCIFETDNPVEFKLTGTSECLSSSTSVIPAPGSEKSITDGTSAACACDSNAIFKAWGKKENQTTSSANMGSVGTTAAVSNPPAEKSKEVAKTDNWWSIFVKGFLGGLLALLTPCVFPMIPLTVSFFTKRSKTRAKGITNALLYGVSIIIIYVTLGLGVSFIFGSDALNSLSTNVWFNLFFFALLVVFGASFLGAFEIVLPSRFVNKIDALSD